MDSEALKPTTLIEGQRTDSSCDRLLDAGYLGMMDAFLLPVNNEVAFSTASTSSFTAAPNQAEPYGCIVGAWAPNSVPRARTSVFDNHVEKTDSQPLRSRFDVAYSRTSYCQSACMHTS